MSLDDKKAEIQCAILAQNLGIGPKILYQSADFNVIVTEFINGKYPDITTFYNNHILALFAQNLKKLHNSSVVNKHWSVFDYIKNEIPKDVDNITKIAIQQLNNIEIRMKRANFPKKLCHNDLHSKNLFLKNDNILFIDWGDAGISDPFWDLARISMEFGFDATQDTYFLTKYLGVITDLDKSRFYLMKQVFLIRTALKLRFIQSNLNESELENVIKIFMVNGLPINIKSSVSWQDVSNHAMDLFLKNCKTNLFNNALKMISADLKL